MVAYLVPRQATERSCALLVGVDRYDHWDDLPGVRHNLDELHAALVAGHAFAPERVERCTPAHEVDLLQRLERAIERARGGVLLLLYFAGHGRLSRDGGELFLMVGRSRPATVDSLTPYADAVSWHQAVFPRLHHAVTPGTSTRPPVRRIVVVLDCCNAGNALSVFDPGTVSEGSRRITVLAAVQVNRRIAAGDATGPTPYTEALVDLLRHGVAAADEQPGPGQPVCTKPLAEALVSRMAGRRTHEGDRWVPRHHLAEAGPDILLGWTVGDAPAPPPGAAPPPRWDRLRRALRQWLRGARGTHWHRAWHRALRQWPRDHPRQVVTALTVLAVALVVLAATTLVPRVFHRAGPCPVPTELRLLTDPDTAPPLRRAASAFVESEANHDGNGCRRTGVTVNTAKSTDVVAAMGQGWRPGRGLRPLRDIGAQPDIWIPGSSTTYELARSVLQGTDEDAGPKLDRVTYVAYTPVVLYIPGDLAVPKQWPNSADASLAELLAELREHNDKAPPVVLRADPEHTDAAQLATAALYGVGDGTSSIPTSTVRRVETQTRRLAPTPHNARELLCALATQEVKLAERAAVLLPEQVLLRNPCDGVRHTSREFAYPTDTHWLDLPFVHVTWPSAERDQTERNEAVRRFGAWLLAPEGQRLLLTEGYWTVDPSDDLASRLRPPPSLSNDAPSPGQEPFAPLDPETARQALASYRRAADGPGQVLYLLDHSGSMLGEWASRGGAVDLVTQSLWPLGDRDQYGIWLAPGENAAVDQFLRLGRHPGRDPEQVARQLKARGVAARTSDPVAEIGRALAELAEHGDHAGPQLLVYVTDNDDVDDHVDGEGRRGELLEIVKRRGVPLVVVSLRRNGCGVDKPLDEGRAEDTEAAPEDRTPRETVRELAEVSHGRCLDTSLDDLAPALRDEVARVGTGDVAAEPGEAPRGGREEDR